MNRRSGWLPALWVAGDEESVRMKDWRSEVNLENWGLSGGRLRSPSMITGILFSGLDLTYTLTHTFAHTQIHTRTHTLIDAQIHTRTDEHTH